MPLSTDSRAVRAVCCCLSPCMTIHPTTTPVAGLMRAMQSRSNTLAHTVGTCICWEEHVIQRTLKQIIA